MDVVPVNFGLKYRPPKLGIQYYVASQPSVTLVHEIPLAFLNKTSNIDSVIKDLVDKNKLYLNPKVVSTNQIKRLLSRLVQNTQSPTNKENSQMDTN